MTEISFPVKKLGKLSLTRISDEHLKAARHKFNSIKCINGTNAPAPLSSMDSA
jgi:hypothetical protein